MQDPKLPPPPADDIGSFDRSKLRDRSRFYVDLGYALYDPFRGRIVKKHPTKGRKER